MHHQLELLSKSTGVHAKVLAYDDVSICEFPDGVPTFNDKDEVLLLFPSEVCRWRRLRDGAMVLWCEI